MTKPDLSDFGLRVEARFVPWSKSRNAKPDAKTRDRSLNWQITLWQYPDGAKDDKAKHRRVLTTDYSAGIGHCPSYHQGTLSVHDAERIARETETGKHQTSAFTTGRTIEPDPVNVVYSLVCDAEAIDYATFEDWATSLGYDPDSRKAETIYRACLEIALKLRRGLGDKKLAKLREAFQGY